MAHSTCSSSLVAGCAAAAVLLLTSVTTPAKEKAAPAAAASTEPNPAASSPRIRVITQEQYANTIAYVFGQDIKVATRFPPIPRTKGLLAIGAANAVLTPGHIEQFIRTGQQVADQIVDAAHREYLVPCRPARATAADHACAEKFLQSVGRLLYRRPLTAPELASLVNATDDAANRLGDFYQALAFTLGGMLSSADFLYIAESAEPDPSVPGQYRLEAYSLASRMSLLLWNSFPDDLLLQAAERGDLHSSAGLQREVNRLLASTRLQQGMRAFFGDMLAFDNFANLAKDPVIYPAYRPQVAGDAAEQLMRTLSDHLLTRRGDYRELFTTRRTFINGSLGAIYQVPVDQTKAWTPYEFPADGPRAGLLTQVGFLSLYSHAGRSSPTKRGRALREIFLCQNVPDPPPNVDFSIVEDPNAHFTTARERLSAHNTDPTCAGCHRLTDPMGLTLERFDGAGQFRTAENKAPIDTSGELDGKRFDDAVGLGRALHDNPATVSCLVTRLYSYALGRETNKADQPVVGYFTNRFASAGYRVPDLMQTIALSTAFRAAAAPEATPAKVAAATNRSQALGE
jgi:hypothetical protein